MKARRTPSLIDIRAPSFFPLAGESQSSHIRAKKETESFDGAATVLRGGVYWKATPVPLRRNFLPTRKTPYERRTAPPSRPS